MIVAMGLSAAFFNALSSVIGRVGLGRYDPFSGYIINLLFMFGGALIMSLFTTSLDQFISEGALYFAISGIMGPLVARFLLYVGIHRVGASITMPIHGTRALYGVIGGILFLDERLTLPAIVGILLILAGLTAISLEESGGTTERKWSKKDLIFPIMAAALLGTAHVIRKFGLNITPNPVVGVTVQNTAALLFLPALAVTQYRKQQVVLNEMRAWVVFGLSGLTMVVSQYFLYSAINLGQVAIASPLVSISPLFGLILVAIFLRKLERITWKIVAGALLIVTGTVLLNL
jgi:drug/metabolite transporter (DMT)-like permease